jgi:hypothetical protein
LEVADEALDEHLGLAHLDELHRLREVVGAPVGHVVAVHARQHHVADAPSRHGL